ncbi:hypothetical protein [Sporosarcina cascadiensis]|uniref:hypothetical protein n=1 Tax=Sporosarcina cascadiensis TaxID=2660747 RepID=UPI00129B3DCE|nr:hypothetical protein [Sporosarcina cascadiensis]
MNLQQMKEIEDLKEHVKEKERQSATLFKQNVEPLVKKYEDDFMANTSVYFKENGFDIEKADDGSAFKAEYKELWFSVEKSIRSISIREGTALKAMINISFNRYMGGSMSIPADKFLAEKAKIQHELNRIEREIECFSNPNVYYEYEGRRFTDTDELISLIF